MPKPLTPKRRDLERWSNLSEGCVRTISYDPSEKPSPQFIKDANQFVYADPANKFAVGIRRKTFKDDQGQIHIGGIVGIFGADEGQFLLLNLTRGCRVFRAVVINHVLGLPQYVTVPSQAGPKEILHMPTPKHTGMFTQLTLPDDHPKKKKHT